MKNICLLFLSIIVILSGFTFISCDNTTSSKISSADNRENNEEEADLPAIAPLPNFVETFYNKSTTLKEVSFTLTPSSLLDYTGRSGNWNVYDDSTVESLTTTGVGASLSDNLLTLYHDTDVPLQSYFIAFKENGRIETERTELTVTTSETTWIFTETFESISSNSYSNVKSINIPDDSILSVIGMTLGTGVPERAIEGSKSLVMTGKSSIEGDRILLSNIPAGKGLGKISFQWRSWGGAADNGELYIEAGSNRQTLIYTSSDTVPQTWEFDFNDSTVTRFSINPKSITTTLNTPRIIIDNLRWNYAE